MAYLGALLLLLLLLLVAVVVVTAKALISAGPGPPFYVVQLQVFERSGSSNGLGRANHGGATNEVTLGERRCRRWVWVSTCH